MYMMHLTACLANTRYSINVVVYYYYCYDYFDQPSKVAHLNDLFLLCSLCVCMINLIIHSSAYLLSPYYVPRMFIKLQKQQY